MQGGGGGCRGHQDGPGHDNHSLPAVPSVLHPYSHSSRFVVFLVSGAGVARASAEPGMLGVNGVRWQTPG